MKEPKVPVQSLIDHIKTAIDVDPWAKEMAEDLLKEHEAVEPEVYFVGQDKYKFYRCPECKTAWYCKCNYCLGCGRIVNWNG